MKFLHDWNDSEIYPELTPLGSYLLKIADFEARQVGASSTEKSHLFLAILKSVDVDLATIDFDLPLLQRDPILASMLTENTKLRKIYSLGKVDARLLRKTYREQIRISDIPNQNEGRILKYAPCTLACLQLAKNKAMGYKVSSLHLLKVLLEENVAQRNEVMEKTSVSKSDLLNALDLEIGGHFHNS